MSANSSPIDFHIQIQLSDPIYNYLFLFPFRHSTAEILPNSWLSHLCFIENYDIILYKWAGPSFHVLIVAIFFQKNFPWNDYGPKSNLTSTNESRMINNTITRKSFIKMNRNDQWMCIRPCLT